MHSDATPTQANTSREALPYFATPHHHALSAIQNPLDGSSSPKVNRSANATPIGSLACPHGVDALSGPQDSASHREILTDPYDGTTLGIMTFSTDPFLGDNDHSRNEELWTQLSRITDLQTEIARMHLDMEGIGVGKGKGKLGESKDRRHQRSGEGSRHSQSDVGLEEYDVEGGMGMDDGETEQNRARQEEFAKLADQFEGRKESINAIMTKLDDLSKALTGFHELQAPEIKMPKDSELKALLPYLQRADEVKHQEPIIAYWCIYYAAQQGIAIQAKDTASRHVLFALLDALEKMKKEIGPTDAIDDEAASSAYFENFALRVFALADNEDRQGNATRGTAKKFLVAANFLEVLHTFPKGQLSENIDEKIRYAKWKAADIAKAFREGKKPTPGPAGPSTLELQPTEEAGVPNVDVHMQNADTEPIEPSHSPRNAWVSGELEGQPSPVAVTPPPMPPKPFNAPSQPSTYQENFTEPNLPQVPPLPPTVPSAPPYLSPPPDFPVQYTVPTIPPPPPVPISTPSAPVELAPALVVKVQKHCRYAISALDYEDAEQAKKELRTALALLGG